MSLTRKMLKGMGLTEEQVDSIIEEHTSVTDALKEQAQKYKADAEKLPAIQKELDDLKAGGDDWEDKYNAEHKAFEDYKKDIESKAELSKTKDAYKALLKSQDISENRIGTILKLTDFSEIKLTKDGKIANEDKVIDKIKEDWSDLIGTKSESGASVDTPPNGGKHYASKDEIMKIRDASERQKAISENLELFGY